MYILIEYRDAYSKGSRSYWQYFRDEPVLNDNSNINDFPNDNNKSISFKFKQKITDNKQKTMRQKMLKQWFH